MSEITCNNPDINIENSIQKQLLSLFQKWKTEHTNDTSTSYPCPDSMKDDEEFKSSFIPDGYVDINKYYDKSNTKVLFLLKEAGLSEKKKNLRVGIDTPLECYMDDHWYKHIINEVDRDNYKADNYLNKFIIMCEVIGVNPDQTAHMNINKRGGDGSSIDKKLIGYINIFKNYINAEIKILNPDIIIACIGPNKNKIKNILFTDITPFDFNIDNHICHLYTGTYTYGSRKIPVYGMYHPGTLGWAKNNNNYKKIFEELYTKYQRT